MAQIDFSPDQQILAQLANDRARDLVSQAESIRSNADTLIAETIARIATRNGVQLPVMPDGQKLHGEWVKDKNGMIVGFSFPDPVVASEAKPE